MVGKFRCVLILHMTHHERMHIAQFFLEQFAQFSSFRVYTTAKHLLQSHKNLGDNTWLSGWRHVAAAAVQPPTELLNCLVSRVSQGSFFCKMVKVDMCARRLLCALSLLFSICFISTRTSSCLKVQKKFFFKKPSALHHSDRCTLSERFGVGEILPACEVS